MSPLLIAGSTLLVLPPEEEKGGWKTTKRIKGGEGITHAHTELSGFNTGGVGSMPFVVTRGSCVMMLDSYLVGLGESQEVEGFEKGEDMANENLVALPGIESVFVKQVIKQSA